jgi:cell shape-determining protein MreD
MFGIDFKCFGIIRYAFAESFHFGINDTSRIIIVGVVVIYIDELVAFFECLIVSSIFEERTYEHEAQFGALWVSFDG